MLDKERFLAIKKLARDIREENKKMFKALEKENVDKAIDKKNEFIESVVENLNLAFSDGEQGREEKQLFRANILIPDDLEFYDSYSQDKNIRKLMNKYAVSIEDIMSKITELNIYGKYIDGEDSEDDSLLDEMLNISPEKATNLLDEIDNLSSVMEDLTENKSLPDSDTFESDLEENKKESGDDMLDTSFDDITSAINGFIDDYNDNQKSLEEKEDKIDNLETEITRLETKIKTQEEENKALAKENRKLQEKVEDLEKKLVKSTDILNKIYHSIPKK